MIRKALPDDIPEIRRMAEVAFRDTYRLILSPDQMDYMMDMMYSEESLRKQFLVDGHIFHIDPGKGYVSFRRDGLSTQGFPLFHLEKLYVMPAFQKTGLGRELFASVVSAIKDTVQGAATVELNVNRHNPAVGFYEHLGMIKARSGDFPIGNGFFMNDYIMSMDLV